jgi:hypothetical protein
MQNKIRALAALTTLLGSVALLAPRQAEATTAGGCHGYDLDAGWCTGFEGCTLIRASCSNVDHTQSCVWEC